MRLGGAPDDRERPVRRVHRLETAAGVIPLMKEVHHRILPLLFRDLREGLEVLGVDAELLPEGFAGLPVGAVLGLALHPAQEGVALRVRAGTRGAAVADPELLKGLRARGRREFPAAGFARLERGQFAPAGEDHPGAGRGHVGDRVRDVPAVAGVKGHCLGEAISAGGEDHPHGLRQRPRQLPDGEPGTFERSERSIGATRVRPRQPAGPGIVTVRRHVQVPRDEREGERAGREQGEQTG